MLLPACLELSRLPVCSSLQICLGDVMTNRVVDEVESSLQPPLLPWTFLFPSQSVVLWPSITTSPIPSSSEPTAPGWAIFALKPLLGLHQVPELNCLKRVGSISVGLSWSRPPSSPSSLLPLLLQWFVLNDTTSGRLHLQLEWLSLIASPEALTQVRVGCQHSLPERCAEAGGQSLYELCGRGRDEAPRSCSQNHPASPTFSRTCPSASAPHRAAPDLSAVSEQLSHLRGRWDP